MSPRRTPRLPLRQVIGYRRLQATTLMLLAALITTCAAFAPLYDRAIVQALVDVELARTPVQVSALTVRSTADQDNVVAEKALPPAAIPDLVPDDVRASFGTPVVGASATADRLPSSLSAPTGSLEYHLGQCRHVRLLSGRCPTAPGEIAVSPTDVRVFHLAPGATVVVGGNPGPDAQTPAPPVRLRVVGTYRQLPGDYWFGQLLGGRSGLVNPNGPGLQHDVWLTSAATFTSAQVPPLADATSGATFPVRTSPRIGVDRLLTLADDVTTLQKQAPDLDRTTTLTIGSGLVDLAVDVRHQQAQPGLVVPLLMTQLALLAVFVLWLVLGAATEQRRPEVALAYLRGRGRGSARRLLLRELLPVVLAGLPLGVAAALGLSWLARHQALPGRAPFELPRAFWFAVGAAFVVLLGVCLVAVVRVTREPVDALLRRVAARRSGWGFSAGETLLLAVSGTAAVAFVTGGLSGPLAVAAPTLLALVVGLVLSHVTAPAASVLGRRLLARGSTTGAVGVLEAARSPATRRLVAILTVAAALLAFSVDAVAIGARNRTYAAQQEAGAPLVAEVLGSDLPTVRRVLTRIDPAGRTVTPVVEVRTPGQVSLGTLAVVPRAFSRIALWPGTEHPGIPWRDLAAPTTRPIRLTGDTIRLDATGDSLSSVAPGGRPSPLVLDLALVDSAGRPGHVTAGALPQVTGRTSALVATLPCRSGCLLVGLTVRTLPSSVASGSLRIDHVRTSVGRAAPTDVAIGPATQWQRGPGGAMRPVSTSPGTLTVVVQTDGLESTTMNQAWLPGRVPALVAGSLQDGTAAGFAVRGIDGEDRPGHRVGRLPRVPASPQDTAVVNLDAVQRGAVLDPNSRIRLWFARDDHAALGRVRTALHRAGVELAPEPTTLAGVRQAYDESTAAWSLGLGVFVGVAGLLVGVLVIVVLAVTTWRLRSRDLAALRMGGLADVRLRTIAVVGQLAAVVVAVVAGTACGLYGAQLALPDVPLFARPPLVSTLDLSPAWWAVLLAAFGSVLVLGLTAWLTGRSVARRATLERLREAL